MKKLLYLFLFPLFAFSFQSCSSDEEDYDEWRKENEAAFESITKKPDYFEASIPGGPGSVFYKVLEKGSGDISPIYTSKVKTRYKGSLYTGTTFEDRSNVSTQFNVNSVIKGWGVALQNMKVGDKWEVWIPWHLGYGSSGSGSTILPYSTLVFEMELVEISDY